MEQRESRSGWLGRQDSNLGSRDQNPLPYRLATPHRPGIVPQPAPLQLALPQLALRAGLSDRMRKSARTASPATAIQTNAFSTTARITRITANACDAARIHAISRPSRESSERPANR